MNLLAHLYLSNNQDNLIVGNFIADSVKGNQYLSFERGIQKGILMHREIDFFSDTHPHFLSAKKIIYEKYRKYSGVLIDIYFDHILAKNWTDFHSSSINEFSSYHKSLLDNYVEIMPEKSKLFFNYIKHNGIPEAYAETDGIEMILKGMSKRTKFDSGIENGTIELIENYDNLKEMFYPFFSSLRKQCEKYYL